MNPLPWTTDGPNDKQATANGINLISLSEIGQPRFELIHIPSNEKPAHFQLHEHVHKKRPAKSYLINSLCIEVWDY